MADTIPTTIPPTQSLPTRPIGIITIDCSELPDGYNTDDCYALRVEGDCLAPLVKDGSRVVVDPHRDAFEGELAVLEGTAGERAVKRLVSLPPPGFMKFAPGDGIVAFIVYEQINPPKQFRVTVDKLASVLPVIAIAPPGSRVAHVVADLERPPREKMAAAPDPRSTTNTRDGCRSPDIVIRLQQL